MYKNQNEKHRVQLSKYFKEFIASQHITGVLLLCCTAISIIISNTDIASVYINFWHYDVSIWKSVKITPEFIINDGLMSIFFLLVGIEIRREITNGELSTRQKAILPLFAALGGMLVPACIYFLFNNNTISHHGWGIPMATDIAFAIGIITLVGKKVPPALKVFLAALAIVDDLGAIVVIGLFYSSGIKFLFALFSIAIILLLFILNKLKVNLWALYLSMGVALWFTIHNMGIHATLSGVILAFFLPSFQSKNQISLVNRVERALHTPVNFVIIPLFALANTCVVFGWDKFNGAFNPMMLGIALGLFLGKPVGIFLFSYIAVKLKWAKLPDKVNWTLLIGAGLLGGIGFTMSIFITMLAFNMPEMVNAAKMTIVVSSFMAGISGFIWLKHFLNKRSYE